MRSELETPQAIRQYERETGRLHERSHYDPGQPTLEREMAPPDPFSRRNQVKEETKRKLVEAVSSLS